MRNYTVAVNAEYFVSTDADALECEDKAAEMIEAALKDKVSEIDAATINTYRHLFGDGYSVKMSVNMVVDVEADDYEVAYDRAITVVENVPYKDGVELVAVGTYDAVLPEDRQFLQMSKYAIGR